MIQLNSFDALNQLQEKSDREQRESLVKTGRDQHSMMVIAILTAIFLPANFAATLMGTQYIKTDPKDIFSQRFNVLLAGELQLWAILSAMLILLTIAFWASLDASRLKIWWHNMRSKSASGK